MKKTERAKLLKNLLKKYHPDTRGEKHQDQIYGEITIQLTSALNKLRTDKTQPVFLDGNKNKNSDYNYYRRGIQYYQNIHPSKFYNRNHDGTYQAKPREDLSRAIKDTLISFALAEFYFNKIIEEYPRSPWLEDSKRKIQLLKKLYQRYSNMNSHGGYTIDSKQFVKQMGLKIL